VQAWTASSGTNSINTQPWQEIPQTMNELNLTNADGMEQVWFVNENGRLSGGAAAVNEALKVVWWIRPFTLLYSLPIIKQLQNWTYRWVAANRHHLPGSTTQCEPKRPSKT